MSYDVAYLDQLEEITDGRCPWRPVRHHFGITAFGVNAWTGHAAGDRIINEHDESEEDEELYLVLRGHAVFELDGERRDAPAGTLVFVRPGVKRTAFAEEPDTSILVIGGRAGKAYEPSGWEVWAPLRPLYEAGEYAEAADRAASRSKSILSIRRRSTTSRAAKASPAVRPTQSSISAMRSSCPRKVESLPGAIRTSTRFATSPASRS